MRSTGFTLLGTLSLALLGQSVAAGSVEDVIPNRVPAATREIPAEERGDIFMARKMFREAIETYSQLEPLTPVALNKIGIAYQQQCDHNVARQYFQRAIKANPKYAEAINNLGTLYYAQKSYRRATSLYKRALALEPQAAPIHVNLGMVWLARHSDAKAQGSFNRALELDPEVFERIGGNGVLVEERDTAERAKFDFYLARLYARSGKSQLALQYIRKAMERGFKDLDKLLADDDFVGVRGLAEFDELMKQPPKVL